MKAIFNICDLKVFLGTTNVPFVPFIDTELIQDSRTHKKSVSFQQISQVTCAGSEAQDHVYHCIVRIFVIA